MFKLIFVLLVLAALSTAAEQDQLCGTPLAARYNKACHQCYKMDKTSLVDICEKATKQCCRPGGNKKCTLKWIQENCDHCPCPGPLE